MAVEKANFRMLVLHEDELRAAALLLQKALDAQGTEGFSNAALTALNACIVALHGLHNEDEWPIAMVSSTRRLLGKPSKRKRVKIPSIT